MPGVVHCPTNLIDPRSAAGRGLVVDDGNGLDVAGCILSQPLGDLAWINAHSPVATEHDRLQSEAHRHGSPEIREMTGLEHENRVSRRERIHEGGFPGTGSRGRVDHDRS